MIDTESLFGSLNLAREFTVTEDHLKLLRHLCDGGLYWDPGEGFGGALFRRQKALRQLERRAGRCGDRGGTRQRLAGIER